jgi:urea transport system ATP-binding protein
LADDILKVQDLHKHYGGSHILRGVSFDLKPGEITVVLGRNGVGKTTLLKSLMGVVPTTSGSITLAGESLDKLRTHQRVRAGLGYVPQGREIFGRLSVIENLQMGLASQPAGTPLSPELFELFPVLAKMRSRRGGDLSGGQQQQLAIARALVAEPKLIIFDEPTEGIQPSIIKDIGRVIRLLRERGDIGILLCEQYFDFAHELADRFVVMSRGEVVARGEQAAMGDAEVRRHLSV